MNFVPPQKVLRNDLQRARGCASIATKQLDGRTRLHSLYQDGCGKIRLPNTHSDTLEAVLINTAGGITGGDRLEWRADIAAGGKAVLTTQACERSYRSMGNTAHVSTRLSVGAGAHLDWLPQETILFAASRLHRRLEVDLEGDATLTAIEGVLLGRDAMGEEARDAVFRDHWRIRRNGRLVHAEATELTGDGQERNGLALLSGNRAFATILHLAGEPHVADRLAATLAPLVQGRTMGLSVTGERLVIRAMAQSGLALRRLIVPILHTLTGAGMLPRLWHL
jgi:urease accessory protein